MNSLYLIPSTLGDTDPSQVIPAGTLSRLAQIRIFVVEELRTARRFLSAAGLTNMWWAVFGDVGVSVLAILNAMRCLRA